MSTLQRYSLALAVAALLAAVNYSTAVAQEAEEEDDEDEPKAKPTLNVGDPAPPLKVEKFVKGEPVKEFKPGHIYVVEFWSTWCGPCRASMPHLTELQKKFKDKVTFIGVNVWEQPKYSDETLATVEKFVEKNSENMGYTVAFDGGAKATDKAYMKAAGQDGIPASFIVGGDGKIAYIGHPMDKVFETTLQELIDGKFDVKKAVAEAKKRRAEEEEARKNQGKIQKLMVDAQELIEDGKVDEGLAKMDEVAKLLPQAAMQIEAQKFNVLLEAKKYEKASEIGAKLIEGPGKEEPQLLNMIAWSIVDPEASIPKDKRDVALAMKAAERAVELTKEKDPAIIDTLARCYWLKGNKEKAIELQTKAVKLAKDDKEMEPMAEQLEKVLEEYKSGGKDRDKKDATDEKPAKKTDKD